MVAILGIYYFYYMPSSVVKMISERNEVLPNTYKVLSDESLWKDKMVKSDNPSSWNIPSKNIEIKESDSQFNFYCGDKKADFIKYSSYKYKNSMGGWGSVSIVDCGEYYFIYEYSDGGPKLFGPFESENSVATSSLKTEASNSLPDEVFIKASLDPTGKVVARGDINGDVYEDAVVKVSTCGASCSTNLMVVLNNKNIDTDVLDVSFDPGFKSSSAAKSDVTNVSIKNGIISLTGYGLDCGNPNQEADICTQEKWSVVKTIKFKLISANGASKYNLERVEKPKIYSISPNQTDQQGVVLTIKGIYLNGFEGETGVWFENEAGQVGVIETGNYLPTGDTALIVTLPSRLCTKSSGESGLPCASYMDMKPGSYKVYVKPSGVSSNKLDFTIMQ